MEIEKIIGEAFELAKAESFEHEKQYPEPSLQVIHSKRSQRWVESLARKFREQFPLKDNYRVFSKYYVGNNDFGLNELLYDMAVCKVNHTVSPKGTKLTYIEKALWLVESEMAKNTRQLVLDFSKLVMGDAENKLFVGPINSYNKEQFEIFKKIAVNCSGNVWVAMIPHPAKWGNKEIQLIQTIKLKNR